MQVSHSLEGFLSCGSSSRVSVIRSAIGEIPLCLGGEVDCVKGATRISSARNGRLICAAEVGAPHPGLDGCMELKTNKVIENERQEGIFHKYVGIVPSMDAKLMTYRKMLKHWAQSWLLGISVCAPFAKITVATDSTRKWRSAFETRRASSALGRLLRQCPYPACTSTLPNPWQYTELNSISALPNPPWHPSPPLHFLHKTLSMVLHHILPTDPTPPEGLPEGAELPSATVWRFSFAPHRGCELWCVGQEDVGANGRWGGVLEEEYVRWRMERCRR